MMIRRYWTLLFFLVIAGFSIDAIGDSPATPQVHLAEGFVPVTPTPAPIDCLLGEIVEPPLECGQVETLTQPVIREALFGGKCEPGTQTFRGKCSCSVKCPTDVDVPCGQTIVVPQVIDRPGDPGTTCDVKTCTVVGEPCAPTPSVTPTPTRTPTPSATPTPTSTPTPRGPWCGNGRREGTERCDGTSFVSKPTGVSQAKWNAKMCNKQCRVEYGPYCGDGHTDPGEECDDGDKSNNDRCTTNCKLNPCWYVYQQVDNDDTVDESVTGYVYSQTINGTFPLCKASFLLHCKAHKGEGHPTACSCSFAVNGSATVLGPEKSKTIFVPYQGATSFRMTVKTIREGCNKNGPAIMTLNGASKR